MACQARRSMESNPCFAAVVETRPRCSQAPQGAEEERPEGLQRMGVRSPWPVHRQAIRSGERLLMRREW